MKSNESPMAKIAGRRFYTCATPNGVLGCHYFEWFDEDFTGRALDVITHLNHRRIYLEKKLKLVEETLAQSYEKRGLEAKIMELNEGKMKFEAERKRLNKQVKLCVFVCVVCVAIMLLAMN
ncbi:GRF-type domain-containing protein [Heracleum sosnowskyi]|uniref:GRF-type domain-containing protein n=1 Tax=Heracleum sosnowskyi TaxID=360622 RepID=A0AAD8IAQ5_9APIA|nr:GRF-type domain-containing protein [Heracleum sosnowskyi]